ncbi:replication initiation protein [uncultured Cetobacterium sp.]|uniref:replication initiation protein n=4 Tax=Cetobacterium TaxID=180162 RepID=UPI0025CD9325|nr:replication initiation protein [uncultured Cetobacterium sp.]
MEKNSKMVIHQNNLASGRFEDFELRELKLFLTLISNLGKSENYYTADSKFIKDFIGMERKSYSLFEETIKKLQKRTIEIKENEDKYKSYSIFSVLEFDKKEKTVEVEYNPKFLPFIRDLNQGNFCKYYLENIKYLSSKYSILFYMRLQSEAFKRTVSISIDEMKILYGKNYTQNNIEKKILKPALEEINSYTDLDIRLEKKYTGKKITAYNFSISKKEAIISDQLKEAIEKAKKNIYISKSKTLSNECIAILMNEFTEEELVFGLKEAYKIINKDFSRLTYLSKIIKTIISKDDKDIIDNEIIIDNIEFKEEEVKEENIKISSIDEIRLRYIKKLKPLVPIRKWNLFNSIISTLTTEEEIKEQYEKLIKESVK